MKKEQEAVREMQDYARQVYAQMHGFYEEGIVPGVRDEFKEGTLGACYDEIYSALERLGGRCGFNADDEDRECLLNALEDMLLESGIKMFEYGVAYAQRKR